MVTIHQVLKQAETEGAAIGHFNVSDLVTLKAVVASARDLIVPVIVGVSEGERQFLGFARLPCWSRACATNTISRFS
jgi:fructose-bisphosphate aldolase, class II